MLGQAWIHRRRNRKSNPYSNQTPLTAREQTRDFRGVEPLEPRLFLSAAPVAVDDAAATAPGTQIVIPVLANDFDPEGVPLDPNFITVISGAGYGTLDIDYGSGSLIYTPDADFVGTELLSYVISDADGNVSNEAIVTITVAVAEPPPAGDDVTFTVPSQSPAPALTVKRDGDNLVIAGQHTGKVLFTQAIGTIHSLTIDAGAGKGPANLTLDLTGGSINLPGGMAIVGGDWRCPDIVTIHATAASDQVAVDGSTVTVNGLAIELDQVEKLKVKTAAGVQHYNLAGLPHKPLKMCRALMAFKLHMISKTVGHCA